MAAAPKDDTSFFCRVGERLSMPFQRTRGKTFYEKMMDYDRGTCSFWQRESFALWITILIIVVLGGIAFAWYRKSSEEVPQDNDILAPVDKVTVYMTAIIIGVGVIHYVLFVLGMPKHIGLPRSDVSHSFLKYSLFYGFALGVLGPIIAFSTSTNQETLRQGITPYWASIFLTMLFAYYFYAMIHHYFKPRAPGLKQT